MSLFFIVMEKYNLDGEDYLIKKAKQGDKKAIVEIIKKHEGLIYSIIHRKYIKSPAISEDDLLQEGRIGILKAIEKFDIRRGINFGTYAYYWIEKDINKALLAKNSKLGVYSLEEFCSDKYGGVFFERLKSASSYNNFSKTLLEEYLLDKVFSFVLSDKRIKDRDIEVFKLHFFDSLTYSEIGERYGLKKQYVYRIIKKVLRRIRKEINSKNLYDIFLEYR